MAIASLITIGALAALLGVALGRYVWPGMREDHRTALASAQAEIARLDKECSMLRSEAGQLESERKAASDTARTSGEEVARLTERVAGLIKQTEEQSKQNSALEIQREAAVNECKTAFTEVARFTEREIALTDKIATQAAQLADQQKQLTVELENVANRIVARLGGPRSYEWILNR